MITCVKGAGSVFEGGPVEAATRIAWGAERISRLRPTGSADITPARVKCALRMWERSLL